MGNSNALVYRDDLYGVKSTLGVIYISPITPFSRFNMRDVFVRLGWKKLSKHTMNVQNLKGGSIYEE